MNIKDKQIYIFIDIDGCLVKAGLETEVEKMSLEEWISFNEKEVLIFRDLTVSLRKQNIKIGLSTGRNLEFSKKIIDYFFGGKIDESIIEGGLFIYNNLKNEYRLSEVVNTKSFELLKNNRDIIIDFGIKNGGILEEGKILTISFNAPLKNGKRDTDNFKNIFLNYLDNDLKNNLIITNSATAVDITPKGVDKKMTIEKMIGSDGVICYIGDGKNDETVMRSKKTFFNIAPANSHEDIKKLVMEENKDRMGYLAKEKELKGVIEGLNVFNNLINKNK